MKRYSWKFNINANAESVGKELEEIEMMGEVTSEQVLEYAEKNPNSELHKCFEWDNEKASKNYRLIQANRILCSISIEIKEEPVVKQRIYVNVRSQESGEKTFKNIKEVLKNDDEYQQLIDKAKKEFVDTKDKYETLLNKNDLRDIIFEIYREV